MNPMDISRPARQVRLFDLNEFKNNGNPKVLGKVVKKFNKLAFHKNDRKMKFPQRGLKLVKSSDVAFTPAKAPYF